MSLISCPECGAEKVSSFAKACPHCGFPVAEHLKAAEEEKRAQEVELERRNSGLTTIAYVYAGEGSNHVRILHEGKVVAMIRKGSAGEIACEDTMRLLFYVNDEIFQSAVVEPGYDYVVELRETGEGKPELVCSRKA